eukprot:212281_1
MSHNVNNPKASDKEENEEGDKKQTEVPDTPAQSARKNAQSISHDDDEEEESSEGEHDDLGLTWEQQVEATQERQDIQYHDLQQQMMLVEIENKRLAAENNVAAKSLEWMGQVSY